MENTTIIVPFWNGNKYLNRLLNTIPQRIPVTIVRDHGSDSPIYNRQNTTIIERNARGYFSGAVNTGIQSCDTDVVVLNQDVWFENSEWVDYVDKNRNDFALFGDGVLNHPAWPKGYVQGTFMFMRRDAINDVGLMNQRDYPLWGSTCEWQLRACRKDYSVLPSESVPGLMHEEREEDANFGSAIIRAMMEEPDKRWLFVATPPQVSVIMPCYNYGHYLEDAINSLLGGQTSLGMMKPQTYQSFEIIIVDDASTDNTEEIARAYADDWKAIKYIRLKNNLGTAGAFNEGIKAAHGRYITHMSSDDMRREYHIENMLRACYKNLGSFVYGDVTTFTDGKTVKQMTMPEYNFEKLLRRNHVPAGIMYPKKAWVDVGGVPSTFDDGREDWAFAVALGEAGYCGVNIHEKNGTLYRREKQGRSYKTAKARKKGHGYYLSKMKARFKHLYEGEFPVGCCGRGNRKAPKNKRQPQPVRGAPMVDMQVPGDMILVEYIGKNLGTETWYGKETRTAYKFGRTPRRRLGTVHKADLDAFLQTGQFRVSRAKKRVKRKPAPKPAPKPVVAAEPKQEIVKPVIEVKQEVVEIEKPTLDTLKDLDVEIEPSVNATNGAIELASELGVDIESIEKEGRVTKYDVRNYYDTNSA